MVDPPPEGEVSSEYRKDWMLIIIIIKRRS